MKWAYCSERRLRDATNGAVLNTSPFWRHGKAKSHAPRRSCGIAEAELPPQSELAKTCQVLPAPIATLPNAIQTGVQRTTVLRWLHEERNYYTCALIWPNPDGLPHKPPSHSCSRVPQVRFAVAPFVSNSILSSSQGTGSSSYEIMESEAK